jgi:hypothetical protein
LHEPAERPVGALRQREDGSRREQRVERHREPALARAREPRSGDALDFCARALVEGLRPHHAHAVAGALEARDRLPHLVDAPALQRELLGMHDRLVPEVDALESGRAIDRERLAADAECGHSPAVRVRVPAERGQQAGELLGCADGVAADHSRASRDTVGEERAAARREEPGRVLAQLEEGERVVSVLLDDRLRTRPVVA